MAFRYGIAAVLWLTWVLPFVRKAVRPREQTIVKDVSARWGMIFQGIGYWIEWGFPERQVSVIRIGAGVLLGTLGIAFTRLAVRHLDKYWRLDAGLSAGHQLIQTGPYAIVRHPIYSGMFLMLLAAGLLLAPWPAFLAGVVTFVFGTEIRIRSEDRLLRSHFGMEFDAYSRKVSGYVPFLR